MNDPTYHPSMTQDQLSEYLAKWAKKDNPPTRRLGCVVMTRELHDSLDESGFTWPEGTIVDAISPHVFVHNDNVVYRLESPDFEPVPESMPFPQYTPTVGLVDGKPTVIKWNCPDYSKWW